MVRAEIQRSTQAGVGNRPHNGSGVAMALDTEVMELISRLPAFNLYAESALGRTVSISSPVEDFGLAMDSEINMSASMDSTLSLEEI